MGLLDEITKRRAARERAGAAFPRPPSIVVTESVPVGRTVVTVEPVGSETVSIGYGVSVPRRWQFVVKEFTQGGDA